MILFFCDSFVSIMGNVVSNETLDTLQVALPITSVLASGVVAGFLSGVTFLSVRTFNTLVQKKEADTIKKVFAIWWPYGKSFMVPGLAFNLLSHMSSYGVTGNKMWIVTGCSISSVGLWTALVMKEDIETLRGNKKEIGDEDVYSFTTSFCRAHHPRLGLALFSFVTSVLVVTKQIPAW